MTPLDLRKLRVVLDVSQSELGEFLGVTKYTIHRWERSKQAIPKLVDLACGELLRRHEERESQCSE